MESARVEERTRKPMAVGKVLPDGRIILIVCDGEPVGELEGCLRD